MTDNNKQNPPLDREYNLADFTDKVLENQTPPRSNDQATRELEDIVLAMQAHAPNTPPDEIKQKIKKNVQAVYTQTYANPKTADAKGGIANLFKFLKPNDQKGYQSQRQRRRTMVTQIAVSAAVIVAAIILFFPFSDTPGGYSGAATGDLGFWLPAGILILAAVIIGWLWLKDR